MKNHADKLKVLVAGIDRSENQFTRQLEKNYDCEAVHVDGGGGGPRNRAFPLFCDAAIIVKSHTSHQRMWDVKDAYLAREKPAFIVSHSFMQIKERFEAWLLERRGYVFPAPRIGVGELVVPAAWVDPADKAYDAADEMIANELRILPPQPFPEELPQRKEESMKEKNYTRNPNPAAKFSDEDRKIRDQIVMKGLNHDTPREEIARELNEKGPKKISGTPWTRTDVFALTMSYKKKAEKLHSKAKPLAVVKAAAPAPKPVAAAPTPQAPPPPKTDMITLIQQITGSSDLSADEKVRLVNRVSVGEITSTEFTEKTVVDDQLFIEQVSILRSKDKNPSLTLTKAQAQMILDNLLVLNEFIALGRV